VNAKDRCEEEEETYYESFIPLVVGRESPKRSMIAADVCFENRGVVARLVEAF
jgi:hypothetical protein